MRPRYGTRKHTRAPGFDYRMPGPYFVTVCAQDHRTFFGSALSEGVQRNTAGNMVADVWCTATDVFPDIVLDAFVVMPNHFHALVTLGTDSIEHNPTLGDVIKWFETLTTVEYAKRVANHGWPRFRDRLWQRGSYDHISRNDADMNRIRGYIKANPWTWSRDDLYVGGDPACAG